MSEPTVQVPVSLIEYLEDHVHAANVDNETMAADIAALLSQPTPTAERTGPDPYLPNAHSGTEFVREAQCRGNICSACGWLLRTPADRGKVTEAERQHAERYPAEPPSIDTMAPGTEFLCEGKGVPGVEHHMRVTEDSLSDGTRILWCLTHEFGAEAPYVDPSTIRDVIPPKEDHRG